VRLKVTPMADPKTILVVEDQDEVRGVIARALRWGGYAVIEAMDGQQALDLLAGGLRIDLLVADVVMPRLGGLQLAERLNFLPEPKARPTLLFISGYEHDHSKVPEPLLEKPFGPDTLVAEVDRLMGQ
jgi:two-component system, cell cycle sensor histidine kinase and response regulator CckA